MIEKKDATKMMYEACLTYEPGFLQFADLNESSENVWVLGKCYIPVENSIELKHEIINKLWFTYRKGFPPIQGEDCLTTDTGWGCMIRTGQMMLAEAMTRNLDYNQHPSAQPATSKSSIPKKQCKMLSSNSPEIVESNTPHEDHISEKGKELNEEPSLPLNPNDTLLNTAKRYIMESWYFLKNGHTNKTLLQDSLKLVTKNAGVEISQDALLYEAVGKEFLKENLKAFLSQTNQVLRHFLDDPTCLYSIHNISTSSASLLDNSGPGKWFGPNSVAQAIKYLTKQDSHNDILFHVAMDNVVILEGINILFDGALKDKDCKSPSLVLVIPLRLGLSEMIPAYFDSIKAFFRMRQCIGILGGKPKHASWYIGYTGDDLIYLDPHTVQKAFPLDLYHKLNALIDPTRVEECQERVCVDDETCANNNEMQEMVPHIASYHCLHPSRMPFSHLDPSLSLAFHCNNRAEFEVLCSDIKDKLIQPYACPMFELMTHMQPAWKSENASSKTASTSVSPHTGGDFLNIELEDFEIIE